MGKYVPHNERHMPPPEDAWARFEAAVESYLDAEMRVLVAAAKMAGHGRTGQ